MTKEIRHIDGNHSVRAQLSLLKAQSDRPNRNPEFNPRSNPKISEEARLSKRYADPQRLFFDNLCNPTVHLLRLKNEPPGQRLKAYGALFRMYWENMNTEAEINGAPTERWGLYLRGLEEVRKTFRRDFPDRDFPIDEE